MNNKGVKMIQKELLVVGEEEVWLNPANLNFSEQTLSDYLMKEGGWYDNFGAYLAKAERELQIAEVYYENLYNLKFFQFKEEGGSDKMAEARSKIDVDVQEAGKEKQAAKYTVSRLKYHLRAWDKSHENAQSMGHTLRRSMNRLGNDIREPDSFGTYDAYSDIDRLITHIEPEDL
jgi:hypothetical protein